MDRPPRPNSARLRCAVCGRVFAAGFVPAPETAGEFEGALVCRDCRVERPYQYEIPQITAA